LDNRKLPVAGVWQRTRVIKGHSQSDYVRELACEGLQVRAPLVVPTVAQIASARAQDVIKAGKAAMKLHSHATVMNMARGL
jgi:hypothetical protein